MIIITNAVGERVFSRNLPCDKYKTSCAIRTIFITFFSQDLKGVLDNETTSLNISPSNATSLRPRLDEQSGHNHRRLPRYRSRSSFGVSQSWMSRRHRGENRPSAPDFTGNHLHRLLGNRIEISKRSSVTRGGGFTIRGRVRPSGGRDGETFRTSRCISEQRERVVVAKHDRHADEQI